MQFGASIGLTEMFRRLELPEVERADVVTIDRPQPLPGCWYGYEGVDVVVIAGASTVEKSLLDSQTAVALNQWVLRGGTLVVACAENAEEVFGAESPLARVRSREIGGHGEFDGPPIGSIETFAHGEERLDANSLARAAVEKSRGEQSCEAAKLRCPFGDANAARVRPVDLCCIDLKAAAGTMAGAKPIPGTSASLPAQPGGHSGVDEGPQQGSRLGFVDLTGQLRGALDQFDGVQIIPFWLVATLALLYIAALAGLHIGLGAMAARPAVAWVILPIAIVLFLAIAYAMAYRESELVKN